MLIVRFSCRLPLRELEEFFQFLSNLIDISKVPSYTQICRRMRSILRPEELMNKRNVIDLVMDTTGLKVYGEGEWCKNLYGGKSKWVKLHVAIDPKTGKLILVETTEEHAHDTTHLEKALDRCNRKKGKVLFDGIADSKRCYEICRKRNKKLLTPPSRKAILRREPEWS